MLCGWQKGTDHFWCGGRDQGRRMLREQAASQRPASDAEAGGTRHSQQQQERVSLDSFDHSAAWVITDSSLRRRERRIATQTTVWPFLNPVRLRIYAPAIVDRIASRSHT
jgi:hypothetical protein